MFHRTYPIRLRDGVGPEQVDGLRAVLEAAPVHIPGFVVSELVEAEADSGYDLVWRNTFADEDAFWLYAGHPYHANQINDLLAPDAPASVKSFGSTGTTWSDEGPSLAAEAPDLHRADAALESAGISVPEVHLHEQVQVVPGRLPEYLDAMTRIFLPAAERHGMRLVMAWQSPPEAGENELTFVWSLPGWGAAFRSFVALTQEVDADGEWRDLVRPLRTGGRRRYLLPIGLPDDGRGRP